MFFLNFFFDFFWIFYEFFWPANKKRKKRFLILVQERKREAGGGALLDAFTVHPPSFSQPPPLRKTQAQNFKIAGGFVEAPFAVKFFVVSCCC